jgi:phospholipase/carboxylesterase
MTSRFSYEIFEGPQADSSAEHGSGNPFYPDLPPESECDLTAANNFGAEVLLDAPPSGVPGIFVPDHYEPNYAYPLIVWLETAPTATGRLERRMRQISDRNYFGVSLVISDSDQIEEQLQGSFLGLRRKYHLNTERVYLLGCGAAGTQALSLGLSRPSWFAGVAALSSSWPQTPRLLSQYDQLRGKRVLLGMSESDAAAVLADVAYAARLLWSAGAHVTTLTVSGGCESFGPLLREIDRWAMQTIERPELVC